MTSLLSFRLRSCLSLGATWTALPLPVFAGWIITLSLLYTLTICDEDELLGGPVVAGVTVLAEFAGLLLISKFCVVVTDVPVAVEDVRVVVDVAAMSVWHVWQQSCQLVTQLDRGKVTPMLLHHDCLSPYWQSVYVTQHYALHRFTSVCISIVNSFVVTISLHRSNKTPFEWPWSSNVKFALVDIRFLCAAW